MLASALKLSKRCSSIKLFNRTRFSIQRPFQKGKTNRLSVLTAGFGGIAFGIYVYTSFDFEISNQDFKVVFAEEEAKKDAPWKLYQYATCPFCCKVRTFLDYYDINYEVVEVNPLFRKEVKFSDYKKVPFLKSEKHQLNDSSLIISVLKTYLLSDGDISKILTYYPNIAEDEISGKKKFDYQNIYNVMYEVPLDEDGHKKVRDEAKWRKWVDETFVHTLSPNIYRTMRESFQAMEYITKVGNFTSLEQSMIYYSGAVLMYIIGKRLKAKYHLKNEVRESLYAEAHRWVKCVANNGPFHGGDEPNLADLNMYGVISAIEGLDAFRDLMNSTKISPWYNRMKKKVKAKDGVNQLKVQRMNLRR